MSCKPTVSILMTAYNSAPYIEEAIMSIIDQDFIDWELIVVDDESTDDTLSIIEGIADPRIRAYPISHVGHAAAKKEAFKHATGEFITFFDSDDVAHPQWLSSLYGACVETGADVSACRFSFWRSGQPTIKRYEGELKTTVWDSLRMVPLFGSQIRQVLWNKLYRRRVFDGFEFPMMNPASDVATCYQLVGAANKVALTLRSLVFYRQHDQSISALHKPKLETYLPHRFALYDNVLEYSWEKFPQGKSTYGLIAKRELQKLKDAGLEDCIPPDVLERMEAKAKFAKED